MKIKDSLQLLILILSVSICCIGQTKDDKTKPQPNPALNNTNQVRSSPAYAEVLLRKTELLSDLESLLVEYTEDFAKIKEIRYESNLLQKELEKLLAVNPSEFGKLTAALGKLMVRKAEVETDLWSLRIRFNDGHPDVKRAKRKAEIFEAAVNDILPALKKPA